MRDPCIDEGKRMALYFRTIASGSDGNCIFISDGKTHLLVDVGITMKAVKSALAEMDVALTDISAILITHEHSDHVDGIDTVSISAVFCRTQLMFFSPVIEPAVPELHAELRCVRTEFFEHIKGFSVIHSKIYRRHNIIECAACEQKLRRTIAGKIWNIHFQSAVKICKKIEIFFVISE